MIWIRAEWQFRCGPRAYKDWTQEWFENACDTLRLVATGSKDLNQAAGKKRKRPRLNRRIPIGHS